MSATDDNSRRFMKEVHYVAFGCEFILMFSQATLASLGTPARWIDGGKPLFRLNLNVVSTVLTQDPGVQVLFKFCEGYYPQTASAQDEIELCRLLRVCGFMLVLLQSRSHFPVLRPWIWDLSIQLRPDFEEEVDFLEGLAYTCSFPKLKRLACLCSFLFVSILEV